MKKVTLLFLLTFLSPCLSYALNSKIVVWEHTLNHSPIILDTLQKALDITRKEYGDYQLISSVEMRQKRALKELSKKENPHLDLASFISTAERETKGIAIHIPIMQGVLGYRVCLIKKGTQEKFSGINNRQQWIKSNISIGQQHDWPDNAILKNAGFNVKTSFKKELLFQQLSRNRFDCFSRGVNEVNDDLLKHKSLELTFEKNLLIHYSFPLFFFVNPKDTLLAERLTLGLQRLKKAGIMELLFDNYYRELLINLDIKHRTIIELQNITLPSRIQETLTKPNALFKKKYL